MENHHQQIRIIAVAYPIIQRELTIRLHNHSWYLRPIEDEEKILGSVDYGWNRFNLYPYSYEPSQQKKLV